MYRARMNGVNTDYDGEDTPTSLSGTGDAYHVYHVDGGPRTLSETVIAAVAAIRNVDPTVTPIPIGNAVNPDALDAIFADTFRGPARTEGRVVFTVDGLRVFAHANGHVFIREWTVPE